MTSRFEKEDTGKLRNRHVSLTPELQEILNSLNDKKEKKKKEKGNLKSKILIKESWPKVTGGHGRIYNFEKGV